MPKPTRLDQALVNRGLAATRSGASNLVKLGRVKLNSQVCLKPAAAVKPNDQISLAEARTYVGRGGYKLAAALDTLNADLKDQVVLDVGSSTGGFSEVALENGASKVIAVEAGKDQLHYSLRNHPRIELYEQTDIRSLNLRQPADISLIDVSFISLREILPSVAKLTKPGGPIIALVKPQFEAAQAGLKHKGVIKNDSIRRQILKDFETWARSRYKIMAKADSTVSGSKGNVERFYKLVYLS